MVTLSFLPICRLLLLVTVVRSLDIPNDHLEPRGFDIDQFDDGIPTQLHDPLAFAAEDDATKHALTRRLDIPGTDIDLNTLSDDVYDKVSSKFDGVIDDAKKGLNDTIEAAKDGVNDAIDSAKDFLEDIKNTVEDLYQKVKDKVAEIEKQLSDAVKDWVWEHIGKPLLTIVIILLSPFVLLFLWWLLHLVAKPFARERTAAVPMEMQGLDRYGKPYGTGEHVERGSAGGGGGGGQRAASLIVRSWEGYGQGIICLLCPWYGSFVLWRGRNKTNKELRELRKRVRTLEALCQIHRGDERKF